jgi:hypothetical protein
LMAIRFLLDENVPTEYRTQLQRQEPTLTVWIVGDPGAAARGTLDPEILCWCEESGFVLVTSNRKSMPQHLADHLAAGRHVPGILNFELGSPMRPVLEELVLFAVAATEDDCRDQMVYLPLH